MFTRLQIDDGRACEMVLKVFFSSFTWSNKSQITTEITKGLINNKFWKHDLIRVIALLTEVILAKRKKKV